ncbi:MAG: hypothetical protein JO329_25865 [Planctomycetaceae bacterium]|nr:hypothetical protein [Planctomycetaceae bacterium]
MGKREIHHRGRRKEEEDEEEFTTEDTESTEKKIRRGRDGEKMKVEFIFTMERRTQSLFHEPGFQPENPFFSEKFGLLLEQTQSEEEIRRD